MGPVTFDVTSGKALIPASVSPFTAGMSPGLEAQRVPLDGYSPSSATTEVAGAFAGASSSGPVYCHTAGLGTAAAAVRSILLGARAEGSGDALGKLIELASTKGPHQKFYQHQLMQVDFTKFSVESFPTLSGIRAAMQGNASALTGVLKGCFDMIREGQHPSPANKDHVLLIENLANAKVYIGDVVSAFTPDDLLYFSNAINNCVDVMMSDASNYLLRNFCYQTLSILRNAAPERWNKTLQIHMSRYNAIFQLAERANDGSLSALHSLFALEEFLPTMMRLNRTLIDAFKNLNFDQIVANAIEPVVSDGRQALVAEAVETLLFVAKSGDRKAANAMIGLLPHLEGFPRHEEIMDEIAKAVYIKNGREVSENKALSEALFDAVRIDGNYNAFSILLAVSSKLLDQTSAEHIELFTKLSGLDVSQIKQKIIEDISKGGDEHSACQDTLFELAFYFDNTSAQKSMVDLFELKPSLVTYTVIELMEWNRLKGPEIASVMRIIHEKAESGDPSIENVLFLMEQRFPLHADYMRQQRLVFLASPAKTED